MKLAVKKQLALTKRVVTLDIDSTAVRLLETRGEKVTKWASISLKPGEVEGDVVSNQQALGTKVKQLMTSSGITGRKVTASLSGLYSVSRILTVSRPPGGLTTQEAVLEAARETMPVDTDQLYLSWQTIGTGEGGQEVFVLGVPQDVVDTEVQALRAAGINPHILDLKAMALARVVNKERALVLNIEPSTFDIVMVANGIPEIMRTIAWQPDDLTVEDKAEHLATTLELTADFYDAHHPDIPLDPATPVFITGQMSGDLALMEKLQARLRYPFEPLAPPLEYPAHMPVSQYAVNIGLSLKGRPLSSEVGQGAYLPPDINLVPAIYKPWKPSARQLYFLGFIIVAIVLIFQLYQITDDALAKTANLEARYNILENEMQRRQLELQERLPLQNAVKEYHAIQDMDGNFTEDLKVINSETEERGVQLQSIAHEGNSITINWQADSYAAIENYLEALERSGRFSTPIPRPETGWPLTTRGITKLKLKTSE